MIIVKRENILICFIMGMDRKIENKAKKRRRIIWISVSAVFVGVVFYQIIFGDKSSRLNVDVDKITIEEIREDAFLDYIAVNGTVEPIQTIFLDAVEGGTVDSVFKRDGDVEQGDKLASLSNINLLLEISRHEAEVTRNVNDFRMTRIQLDQQNLRYRNDLLDLSYSLRQAERRYKKNSVLRQEEHISQEEFELSKEQYENTKRRFELLHESYRHDSIYRVAQLESMEESLQAMESNLELVSTRLEALDVRAPVDGELAYLDLEVGQIINRGQTLGRINVLDSYKLRVEIDEHYISRVVSGLQGEFEFAGDNYELEITRIYPEVEAGRFAVDMEFNDSVPGQIRIGQTFRIRLELGESRTALLIPRGGFYQSTGGRWVYVLDPSESVASRREIRIGRQNPRYYEVLEGLEPGEKVIVSSYDNFGNVDKLMLR